VSLNSTMSWLTIAAGPQARERQLLDRHAVEQHPPEVGEKKRGIRLTSVVLPPPSCRPARPVRRGARRGRSGPARRARRPDSGTTPTRSAAHRSCARSAGFPIGLAGLVEQREHALGRREPALQRAVDLGQVLERREQHQHRGHEGDEPADRGLVVHRLHQRDRDDDRDRERRAQLGDRVVAPVATAWRIAKPRRRSTVRPKRSDWRA